LRLLHQIPDAASQTGAGALSAAEILVDGSSLTSDALRLLAHLLEDVLLALVVAVLAARLEVQLVDAPVLEVVGERQHADVVDEVQLTGPIEVEHGRERARVTVEKELHRRRVEVVAQRAERIAVGGTAAKAAEARVRHALERPPERLVPNPADVEDDAARRPQAADERRVDGRRRRRGRGQLLHRADADVARFADGTRLVGKQPPRRGGLASTSGAVAVVRHASHSVSAVNSPHHVILTYAAQQHAHTLYVDCQMRNYKHLFYLLGARTIDIFFIGRVPEL